MAENKLKTMTKALGLIAPYSHEVIEATIIRYITHKIQRPFFYDLTFLYLKGLEDEVLLKQLDVIAFPIDIEFIIEFFEALLHKEHVIQDGIVFTPKYIADKMNALALEKSLTDSHNYKLIDPGCGCGIFLVSAAEQLSAKLGISLVETISQHIYGIDIVPDNVRRCKLILNLYVLMKGEDNTGLKLNIECANSLETSWQVYFGNSEFDAIVGNPPYVNARDMRKETVKFLKQNFETTQSGAYNIFYAFIEYALGFLKETGTICYIVPNNFLTITSAVALRKFLIKQKSLQRIIDFSDNRVFKPVRTYTCILQLSKQPQETFEYDVFEKVDHIAQRLEKLTYDTMPVAQLDTHGWKLVNSSIRDNIYKIEGQVKPIKEFIRTGIATLKDEVYRVSYDGEHYYKTVEDKRYFIEQALIKRLYKIPDLKQCEDISTCCKYILFPYKKGENGFEIIPEAELKEKMPHAYTYLCAQREKLNTRDKGKPNKVAWYAYGRTQGLNKYGKKLVFPVFSDKPRFSLLEDEYALFCNGYAIFENDYIELQVLLRILNSFVMHYYIKHTSYVIEGGYYCYQKRYIEKFSLPLFSEIEKQRILTMDADALDAYLIQRYELVL